jgi:hypothetical protein
MTDAKTTTESAQEQNENNLQIHWYHIVATTAVAILAIIAIMTILRRFDLSLVGSETTLQIAATCADGEERENHYFGIRENEYYKITTEKKIERTLKPEDASLEILEIGEAAARIKLKQNDEWKEITAPYGAEKSQILSESDDCKLKVDYVFSR